MKTFISLFTFLFLTRIVAVYADVQNSPKSWMPRTEDSTQLWWLENPKQKFTNSKPSKDETLCFRYGGKILLFDTQQVRPLDADWECSLEFKGRYFKCVGRRSIHDEFFQPVRFVESGRFFQRVIIEELIFADSDGQEFHGKVRLEISAWPDRLAFRLECDDDTLLHLRYGKMKSEGKKSALLLAVNDASKSVVESELPIAKDEILGCHRLVLPERSWSNRLGTYYPEEHLDRMDRWQVRIRNDTDVPTVARLMITQQNHLPITGFTPMLCEPDGTPTGIPVQISKNWHKRPEKGHLLHEGNWFHGFVWIMLPPNSKRDFVFQMVYARYGGVAAASHAQLSLIGWGHNQFWDQAAVGSFGENICFEPGRVQRGCFITDVRPLMTLTREANAKPWGWSENCGGGDFLLWKDATGIHQPMKGTRTDYQSNGPCLTNVNYTEESRGGEIGVRINVSIPAANDHLRTFLNLRYDVRKPIRWQRLAFFQLGADYYNNVPAQQIAIGDINGLQEEWMLRHAKEEYDRVAIPLKGIGGWISVHGVERSKLKKGHAAASRGIILRSWNAMLGGKPAAPHLSTFSNEWGKGNYRTSVELAPPLGVNELVPGDFIDIELEFVVFPADASAYYGPDEALRKALSKDADTWHLVHRESAWNTLKPKVQIGTLMKPYPLVVEVNEKQRAHLTLQGGLGHLPVTFTGLTQPHGHKLFVNEKLMKFWQTDWNSTTQRWQVTYNIAVIAGDRYEFKFQSTR